MEDGDARAWERQMDLLHFEDFPVGMERRLGSYRLSREEIVGFAREFDPQPFHLEEEAGRRSLLGGLAASGWQAFSILMRLSCEGWLLRAASMGGLGIEEAQWRRPARPGDELSGRMRIVDARPSRSRPQMGLLTIDSEMGNQRGEVVARLRHVNLIGRRGHEWRALRAADAPARAPVASPRAGAMFTWFEDCEIGAGADLGLHHFEEADMIRFGRQYDPQVFHVDPEAARASFFGGLVASGWHVASAFMRCLVETRRQANEIAQARGREPVVAGPSPGFRDLRWLSPVYSGDCVHFSTRLIGKRATSKPGWGLIFAQNSGVKSDGAPAFRFESAVFCPMRAQPTQDQRKA